jgi:subtilisin family serine protease
VAPPATAAWAAAFARAISRSVKYYRNAGVRVVNMSWYVSLGEFEETLDINGVGATQQGRHQLAMQSFDTVKNGFRAAIAAASEILFVCGAGNSNSSNQFNDFVPASFDLPNLITVGAVNGAGNETGVTSFGKVDLYAIGAEVETVDPGGKKVRAGGTSMSSPQVVNLAAKLLAVYPQLTTASLRKLIVDGADTKNLSGDRSIRVLNPARSFELAATPSASAQPPISDPVHPAGFDAAMLARLVGWASR